MKHPLSTIATFITVCLTGSALFGQTVMIVDPDNNPTNQVEIDSVTLSVDGNTVIQNSSQSGSDTLRVDPVFATSLTVVDGSTIDLTFYNNVNAAVVNNNFQSNTGGIGVYNTEDPTAISITNDGLAAFEAAVVDAATNNNLMNYLSYDGTLTNMPDANTADFDLLYYHAFTTDDYIVVAERNGNTTFQLQPLDINGNVIAGANTIQFADQAGGGAGSGYQWDSGYANQVDAFNNQSMYFNIVDVEKFFENTGILAQDQVVYGFRIDNNGNADVKFFGASDNPFTDNPINPNVLIPEPGSLVLSSIFLAAFGLVKGLRTYRKRR